MVSKALISLVSLFWRFTVVTQVISTLIINPDLINVLETHLIMALENHVSFSGL